MNPLNYHGYEAGPDFDRARSQIATPFQYIDIDLTNAGTNQIFNVSGDFLYFDPATTGIVTLELNNQYNDPAAPFTAQAGFAINAMFKQVKLTWTAQAGKKARIMYSTGERVIPANTGVQTVSGAVSISSGAILTDSAGSQYGGSYKSNTPMAANTPDQIFSAAANINGAIIWRATHFSNHGSTNSWPALVAKASAPTSVIDGDVIAAADFYFVSASNINMAYKLERPVKIPAGKGLYMISTLAEALSMRSCLYTLL